MDFLYAFKEVKNLGISAEEFCRMWEKEACLKRTSMLRNRKAKYNKHLNVEVGPNISLSDVEPKKLAHVEIVKCNMEKLKSTADETKGPVLNLKRDVPNHNKDFVDKSMEFLCSQHLLIEKLNAQVDALHGELVVIKSKVVEGHDVKTERMESQIANLQQEVKNVSDALLTHKESSGNISPPKPACTSEISDDNETASDSMCSLKTPYILNTTNQTDVDISVDTTKVSFTLPDSHSTISENVAGNSVTKFTGALSFLSNLVPKLVHGALSVLKDSDGEDDSSESLNSVKEPSFTNFTVPGSSVDWSAEQSSVDMSIEQSLLETTLSSGLTSVDTCSLVDCSNQNILIDKLVLPIPTKGVNSLEFKNNYNSLASEGAETDISKDQLFYTSNKSSNNFKTIKYSNTLLWAEKELKNNSTKAADDYTQVSELVTDTKSMSCKVQKEPKLTEEKNVNSAVHPVQRSFKKPKCDLGDICTTESNFEKYSNTNIKQQHTLIYMIPESGVYFYMSSKEILHRSSQTFYTSLYTTQDKCLKVRLCQYFDEQGHLCIQVLVSGLQGGRIGKSLPLAGLQGGRIEKSLTLAGEGFIYCGYVGGYTTSRIWRLKAFPLHNLNETQELSVKANVCLVEQKGSHKPVTFKHLVRNGYDYDGSFIFNWSVKIVNTK